MYQTQTPRSPFGGGFGGGGAPTDVVVMLGVVFFTLCLRFFAATQIIPNLLQLTPWAWSRGFLWQVVTYPYIGTGGANFWLILELYFLFLFSRSVFLRLGRQNFWKLMLWSSIPPALLALLIDAIGRLGFGQPFGALPLALMQGQFLLGAIVITAFATLYRNATILLFFVLPVRAVLFIPLTLVFALLGFLNTKDLAGLVGVWSAVGLTYSYLTPGGLRRLSREGWLRLQQWWYRRKMDRLRRKRGFTVVPGGSDRPN